MPTVERWTTRSGPRIRYLDNSPGQPVGWPVLFSPGLSDHADEYREMLEAMAPRRVLVVEVRGRGRSEAPVDAGYTAADHAADLGAVVDEEGIDRLHLMTFSRGTTWGLGLLAERMEAVLSVAIGDYWPAEIHLTDKIAESQWSSRFRGRPLPERMSEHAFRSLVASSAARDLGPVLARFPGPLLVAVAGGEGGLLRSDAVDRYSQVRPDVEVVVVPGAPHDLFRPDRLFYPLAVLDFIERAEGAKAG